MATLTIKDARGGQAGTVDVADAIFAIEPNKHAVRQSLIAFEANQRAGTHATKTRGMVSGGGRKPFKQKGTGRARQGSSRAPNLRHGAIIFGPQPRDYDQKINKKVKRLALYSALSDLRVNDAIVLVNSFELSGPKTKDFHAVLEKLGVADARRVLVLLPGGDDTVLLSARNLPNVLVTQVENVNIFNLITCDRLVTTPEGIKKLEELIG